MFGDSNITLSRFCVCYSLHLRDTYQYCYLTAFMLATDHTRVCAPFLIALHACLHRTLSNTLLMVDRAHYMIDLKVKENTISR